MTGIASFTIERAAKADGELHEAYVRLLPHLTKSVTPPALEALREIIDSPCNTMLIARELPGRRIVGALTLVIFRIPSGLRAWIEDVVVDQEWRRAGIGEALTRAAVGLAQERGVRSVDLTSRPSRSEAIGLYLKLGFRRRETEVYRLPG